MNNAKILTVKPPIPDEDIYRGWSLYPPDMVGTIPQAVVFIVTSALW